MRSSETVDRSTSRQQRRGAGLELESEARCVARRAKRSGWIVDERGLVENAEQTGPEVVEPAVGVDQLLFAAQRKGHGVDREVPAGEVVADGSRPDLREGTRPRVALVTGLRDVDLHVAPLQPPGEKEGVALECETRQVGERRRVPLDRDVQVRSLDSKQQVPNHAADQVGGHALRDLPEEVDRRQRVHQLGEPRGFDFA